MVTISITDINSNDNILLKNNVNIKLYLDGLEYLNKNGSTENKSSIVTRNNESDLHINPSENITDINIANLSYFNYALKNKEIVNLYKKGFNKNMALIPTKSNSNDYSHINDNLLNFIRNKDILEYGNN
jgi:hypothetical protein